MSFCVRNKILFSILFDCEIAFSEYIEAAKQFKYSITVVKWRKQQKATTKMLE